jgi:hypothetical protein
VFRQDEPGIDTPAALHSRRARPADVPRPSQYADWIENLSTRGVTGGCDLVPNYCPTRPVSRGEMAVFLTKMFGLPLP